MGHSYKVSGSSGSGPLPMAACAATWPLYFRSAEGAAGEYRGSGCRVEVGGEPAGVEATDVRSTKASPWTRLVVGAGAGGGLPRLLLWSVDCLGRGAEWTDLRWLLWL